MKKRSITAVILAILGVIITVIVVDFARNRPDRQGGNPYALEVDQYRDVDPELISHRETRDLSLGPLAASSMDLYDGKIYLTGDSSLVVIRTDGSRAGGFAILPGATCLLVEREQIFIGYRSFVSRYDHAGNLLQRWNDLGERAVVTNLAGKEDQLYVADAGNRKVYIFSKEGELNGEFGGESETAAGHGFIVPSANFDLAVNGDGELWVVNPGRHAIENYSDDGRMRGFWENSSVETEGFLGCCNPARIAVMEDGSFVTSEKGMVRIKIHGPSGALKSVVAPPGLFKEEGMAPDICVDGAGVVYVLDFDRNMVRIFEPRENG